MLTDQLIDVFKSNGYPENYINNCYLGPLSLQTRTKLKKSLKGILNCCKLKIVFKSQNKLAKSFRFKDRTPKELTHGVVYKFQC